MQEGCKWYLRPYCIKRLVHVFCTYDAFYTVFSRKLKELQLSKMMQNVHMNPYFDISSETQNCQKCNLRPLLHSADKILTQELQMIFQTFDVSICNHELP